MTVPLEIGVAVVDANRLKVLAARKSIDADTLSSLLGEDSAAELMPAGSRVSHLYFGSEFCEQLFPEENALQRAIEVARQLDLTFVLATPIANDALVERIGHATAALLDDAEVLVNDWGVANYLRNAFPRRRLIGGRQLAKMIKDPRAPSGQWLNAYGGSYGTAGHRRVLDHLGIDCIELDAPPFATPTLFAVAGVRVSVWAPYGYVAKGRICKVGSLHRSGPDKFAPGRACHRECRSLVESGSAAARSGVVPTMRGNVIYYRHDRAITQVLREAIAAGHVSRLVLCGV